MPSALGRIRVRPAIFWFVGFILGLVVGYFIGALEEKGVYLSVVQLFVVLGLAIMPSIVAWQQIKEGK